MNQAGKSKQGLPLLRMLSIKLAAPLRRVAEKPERAKPAQTKRLDASN